MSINAVYEDSQGNVHESRLDGVDLTAKISIADDFSALVNYAVGDFCYHLGTLYRFTSAHTAGAWSAADVVQVQVGDELSALNSTLNTQIDTSNRISITDAINSTSPVTFSKDAFVILSSPIGVDKQLYMSLVDNDASTIIACARSNGTLYGLASLFVKSGTRVYLRGDSGSRAYCYYYV